MNCVSNLKVSPGITFFLNLTFSTPHNKYTDLSDAVCFIICDPKIPHVCAIASTINTPGIIGNSGKWSSGPHLHFELWQKGTCIDPQLYINF